MLPDEFQLLVKHLCSQQKESEWIEFKHNNDTPVEIGEYVSALSNSATLHNKSRGYIVWGIEDHSLQVIGTAFLPKKKKIGNQELESRGRSHPLR